MVSHVLCSGTPPRLLVGRDRLVKSGRGTAPGMPRRHIHEFDRSAADAASIFRIGTGVRCRRETISYRTNEFMSLSRGRRRRWQVRDPLLKVGTGFLARSGAETDLVFH